MYLSKVRKSASGKRRGDDDWRTERRWYYVRFNRYVLERAGLKPGDLTRVTVFLPDENTGRPAVINIRLAEEG